MKFLTPLILVIGAALSANAQNCEKFADPARRAECYAHYGPPNHYNPPPPHHYPPPPHYNPPPPHHYPPPPPHYNPPPPHHYPPPPPHYGHGVAGPQRTVRWEDLGVNHIPKVVSESMRIYVGGRLVNEVLIRALGNRVYIESITARLADGRHIDLGGFRGTVHDNSERRGLISYNSSLRIDHLEIRATSPNLFGSRGKMQVVLGLAE